MKLLILCVFAIVLILVYVFRCKKNVRENFFNELAPSNEPAPSLSNEEKKLTEKDKREILSKLEKDNNRRGEILFHIQLDLKNILRDRKNNSSDINLSQKFRRILENINNELEDIDNTKKNEAIRDKEFSTKIMEGIKTGNLELINTIFDIDFMEFNGDLYKNSSYFNNLINTIENIISDSNVELTPSPSEGFSNMSKINGININEFRDNYKKNMMDISNKLQKFKMQNNFNIENFADYNPHKHSKYGQIDKLNNIDLNDEAWLKNPNNMRVLQGYNFLSDGQKKGILNGMDKLEQELQGLKEYSASNYTTLNDKVKKIEAQVAKEDRIRQEEANLTEEDKAFRDFNENEKVQELKMKNINQKIADLEKEQKGLNLSQLDSIKSMKSLGDGQVLSVQNIKDNTYNIKANQGCLVSQKVNDNYVLDIGKCSNVKAQSFNVNHIANDDEYNKYLKSNLPQDSGMVYPFNVITSSDNNKMCLNIRGNNIGLQECADSNYARFESLKTEKECDSKYGN